MNRPTRFLSLLAKNEAFTDAARSVDVHRFVRMQARDAQLVVGDELEHRDCSRAIRTHHAIDGGSCKFEALGSKGCPETRMAPVAPSLAKIEPEFILCHATHKKGLTISRKSLISLVGGTGVEPVTPAV